VAGVSNYNIALAALERAKGTLLRYNNVLMEEAPLWDGECHLSLVTGHLSGKSGFDK